MKRILAAAVVAAAIGAFADGDDNAAVLVTTAGPDRYGDGQTVMDGECYALVWSTDGVFDGFSADGSPVDPGDRVVNVGAVAKNGRCRAAFEVQASLADTLAGGVYEVYVLDTRVSENGVVAPHGLVDGKLSVLNGYGKVSENVTIGPGAGLVLTGAAAGAATAGVATEAAADVEQPRVTRIVQEGDKVAIYVKGLPGYMRVRMGDTLSLSGGVTPAVPTDAQDEIKLIVPKVGDKGFYKVIRN